MFPMNLQEYNVTSAADKTKKTDAGKDSPQKSRPKWLLPLLIGVIITAGAGGGAWYFTKNKGGHADEPKATATPAPAQYFALEPAFVVNLSGATDGPRYLQVDVQLMTRDPHALEALQTHAPAIRAALLMLLSQVDPAQIADRAGKEKLQASALAEVQKLLTKETGKPCADELLFTSFVTQ